MPFDLAHLTLVLVLSVPPATASPGGQDCHCPEKARAAQIAASPGCDAVSDCGTGRARIVDTRFSAPARCAVADLCVQRAADARVRVVIDHDAVLISRQKGAPALRDRPGEEAIVIRCREVRSEMAVDGGPATMRLVCTDAEFFTGRGLQGHAARLVYDSSAGRLELAGTGEHHVRLWCHPAGRGDVDVVARNMQFDLKRSYFTFRDAAEFWQRPAGCCCVSDCGCAHGCSRQEPDASSAVEVPPPPLPAAEDRRIFTFSVGFTR